MYPSFEFGARWLRSMHSRFSVSEKICPPKWPLNQGNLHELTLRLKIVRYPGIEVGTELYVNDRPMWSIDKSPFTDRFKPEVK